MTNDSNRVADVCAVVVAGGSGVRMGGSTRKPYLALLGKPLILLTLERLCSVNEIAKTILVVHPDDIEMVRDQWGRKFAESCRVAAIVSGGVSRQESVWNGLMRTPEDLPVVLVHDAVRPLVRRETILEVIRAIREHGAAIAAAPMIATVKESNDAGRIIATRDRERLWQAQTPQGALRSLLIEAYEKLRRSGDSVTDDAQVLERNGREVMIVRDTSDNIKVTTPCDLAVAEALLRWQQEQGLDGSRHTGSEGG
ncbi:MAG TPA: 2-C-methyl-D-erythritol 4-phosphate cytidylyltransferase [Candidatus Brocadiia bacterium]|nr:2-C-methyl-D-erythritol 4-phosphate cytidylyltransferase [Candidatus Brocadiia bacterium]